jgi:hypothetical protein
MEIVAGIKANPVSAEDIAFGLLRVVCTGFVTWTTIIFCAFIGSAVVATSSDSTYKSKNRIRW